MTIFLVILTERNEFIFNHPILRQKLGHIIPDSIHKHHHNSKILKKPNKKCTYDFHLIRVPMHTEWPHTWLPHWIPRTVCPHPESTFWPYSKWSYPRTCTICPPGCGRAPEARNRIRSPPFCRIAFRSLKIAALPGWNRLGQHRLFGSICSVLLVFGKLQLYRRLCPLPSQLRPTYKISIFY